MNVLRFSKIRIFRAWLVAISLVLSSASFSDTFEMSDDRIYLKVQLNGVEVQALLDTSVRRSKISPQVSQQIGPRLLQDGNFIQGVTLEVAGVELSRRTLVVADMDDLPSSQPSTPVGVVLGRELFETHRVTLNLSEQSLTIAPRDSRPPGRLLPVRQSKGALQIPLQIEDLRRVWANLDFGVHTQVLLSRQYALYNGLHEAERVVGQTTGAGLRGRVSRDLVALNDMTIADQKFNDIIAVIDSSVDAPEVSIGTTLLRDSIVTIDLTEKKLWLADSREMDSTDVL